MEDKDLKEQLNQLSVPHDLEQKIRANWKQQLNHDQGQWFRYKGLVAAGVMGLTLAALLFNLTNSTPKLLSLAINDIQSDAQQNIGISIPMDVLTKWGNVNLPPISMPLKMTKYCTLGGNKTIHVQVDGARQGEVHLFIRRGDFDIAFWQSRQGQIDSMPWRLLKPRDDLSVLVLYTHDMNPANVEKLIQTMFYV
jgi:hypothetical protein